MPDIVWLRHIQRRNDDYYYYSASNENNRRVTESQIGAKSRESDRLLDYFARPDTLQTI